MKAEQLSLADYNKIKNVPVVNQDLSASGFTPVANAYYRHTGTTDTYTQGVIYYYDGTEYKALDGSGGGISDVKVVGTSVVTDGVANIPAASEAVNGVVTTGAQTFSGVKTIIASPSDSVQLELQPNVPATGRAYSKMRFNCITSSGSKYQFTAGMSEISTLLFRHMNSFSGTYFKFQNYAGQSFEINVNTGGYPGGQVNCGTANYQLYLNSKGGYNAVPTTSGTLMSTPSTWSSGTSGSVTLTESGTYQIYMNDGKNNINFGVVYFDASADTYAQTPMINDTEGFMLVIEGSAGDNPSTLHIYQIDNVGHTQTEVNYTVYYRRIGI